jgi:hypothetical protein
VDRAGDRQLPTDLGEHTDRFRLLIGDRAGQLASVLDAVFTAALK